MNFQIHSTYQPAGDQNESIAALTNGLLSGDTHQVLLGITGSGKTFTIANVIQHCQKPTLIITHNKTLVSQLYAEFKNFFPDNAVECFVSYYDYYQPEAYIPTTNVYIEKDLSINADLDRLRLSAISKLLSGRRDIIIVASVSCIYGAGNPTEYAKSIIHIQIGQKIGRQNFLLKLVECLYTRTTEEELLRAHFKVKGEVVDINLPYLEYGYRITFFDDEIETIHSIELTTGKKISSFNEAAIYPANLYVSSRENQKKIIYSIQDELLSQVEYFKKLGKIEEAMRIKERVEYDIEMIKELGYCSGIENYSRFFDMRDKGTRPFCLIDYFPKDFLCVIDESHQTIPQIRGMYGGDRSRKINLVEYGFRLPSALDNRPLNFFEFQDLLNQTIYVSATPGDYELELTSGAIVEQVVRPTGILDPEIIVKPSFNQIDDLLNEINIRVKKDERILVTTLTKKMAESLFEYLQKLNVNSAYIHSDVDTLDRVEILRKLRLGEIDVLIGVNLLREGLDLPEVSLVAILDADKEGFLRDERSLTQTAGRAARNINGKVIFYADKVTASMQKTIEETNRRRIKQIEFNIQHDVTPVSLVKSKQDILNQTGILKIKNYDEAQDTFENKIVAEPKASLKKSPQEIQKDILFLEKSMKKASQNLDFIEAIKLRDKIQELKKMI